MNVRDFKKGFTVFFLVLFYGAIFGYLLIGVLASVQTDDFIDYVLGSYMVGLILLSFVGFVINYTPVSVKNGIVSIPARDQIRTFLDIITLNPITGFFRRRKYSVNDIQNVANGYTKPVAKNKKRSWNVVITGVKNGKSFSQRIDVSNKQVRDEVRNILKNVISGKVSSEFSY